MDSPGAYRERPVIIQAINWTGENYEAVRQFLGTYPEQDFYGDPVIGTPEGRMTASRGDWIVRGIKGEFYPCKPGIFEATYDEHTPTCPSCEGSGWLIDSDERPIPMCQECDS